MAPLFSQAQLMREEPSLLGAGIMTYITIRCSSPLASPLAFNLHNISTVLVFALVTYKSLFISGSIVLGSHLRFVVQLPWHLPWLPLT